MGNRKLNTVWRFIRRHKYSIVIIGFIVVVGFWDQNSFWHRYEQQQEIRDLNAEIYKYKRMFKSDTERLNELEQNPKAIVRIARERYFMKTADEDVYIFEGDDETIE